MNSYLEEDQFDRLPDALVNVIFNKLEDAKSLCRCMSVCKRFGSIIPQIDTVAFTIPPRNLNRINDESNCRNSKSSLRKNLLKTLISKVVVQPLHFLLQIIKSKSKSAPNDDECSCHMAIEGLKSFNEIRTLHIELPGDAGEIRSNHRDTLLKWKAEYGSKLESCVILGATSFHRISDHQKSNSNGEEEEEHELQHESSLNNDEMRLRVVWTISCLIAASSRHYLLHQVVSDHRMLQRVVITDASKQGKLCMRREQIEELRNSVDAEMKLEELSPSVTVERTSRVSALRMKMWYVPVLELPASGWVMKGATLVVIMPIDGPTGVEIEGDWVARAFDGEEEHKAFGEAARMIMKKKKTCSLEINSEF